MAIEAVELGKGDVAHVVVYSEHGVKAFHGSMLRRVDVFDGSGCVSELAGGTLDEGLDDLCRRPQCRDGCSERMRLFDVLKATPEIPLDLRVGQVVFVENNGVDDVAQVVRVERVADRGVRPARHENEERHFVVDERHGQDPHDIALDVGALALVQPINDDEPRPLLRHAALVPQRGVRLQERVDDQGLELCFEGTAEDRGVAFDGLGDVAPCVRDGEQYLVRDGRHEVLVRVQPRNAPREEERTSQEPPLEAQLRYRLCDGGLARAPGPVYPHHPVLPPLVVDPAGDHGKDGGACAGLALGRVVLAPRIVESPRGDAALEGVRPCFAGV